jgi:hypothetical protein
LPAVSLRNRDEPREKKGMHEEKVKANELIRKLGITDPDLKEDVHRGVREGYPECCITFFVLIWKPVVMGCLLSSDSHSDRVYYATAHYHRLDGAAGGEYRSCPACLLAGLNRERPQRIPAARKEPS